MSALTDFVLDRLAEAEEIAQRGNSGQADPEHGWGIVESPAYSGFFITPHVGHVHELVQAKHIIRHPPIRVIEDIRVKRNLVEWLNDTEQALDDDPNDDHMQGQFATLDFVVRSFAWLYRNHPEYREEFKTGGLDPA